ncbi:MAG: hypothetical protein EOM08_05655 [Clostridia bacterium]|nr:hypothetical protein [Clostridia bacterium]
MKRLNIGIDIDGTLTEPFYWLRRANDYFGTSVSENEIVDYDYHQPLRVSRQESDRFYDQYGELLHWEAKVRPGAQLVIRRLFKQHNIHFITARSGAMQQVSLKWFEKYDIPHDSLTLLGSTDKVATAKRLRCDWFIEDRYENAVALAASNIPVLLIDCSYNRKPLPDNVIRINSWSQVESYIDTTVSMGNWELAL